MRRVYLQCCSGVILLSQATVSFARTADFPSRIVPLDNRAPHEHRGSPVPDAIAALRPSAIGAAMGSREAESAAPPGASYDLRVPRAYQANAVTALTRTMRARGTGMKDVYAQGEHGLRVSVGSSYHIRYRAPTEGAAAAAGKAALMRVPLGAVNLRDGYESYAPVAMLGYDAAVNDRMKIGVEGGMMLGRSTAMYADETIPKTRDASHSARNPVADLVMTYAF